MSDELSPWTERCTGLGESSSIPIGRRSISLVLSLFPAKVDMEHVLMASSAAVKDTVPLVACGQMNLPLSSLFAKGTTHRHRTTEL
jgi:hypothetical protein